jgi:hypothetical protein
MALKSSSGLAQVVAFSLLKIVAPNGSLAVLLFRFFYFGYAGSRARVFSLRLSNHFAFFKDGRFVDLI